MIASMCTCDASEVRCAVVPFDTWRGIRICRVNFVEMSPPGSLRDANRTRQRTHKLLAARNAFRNCAYTAHTSFFAQCSNRLRTANKIFQAHEDASASYRSGPRKKFALDVSCSPRPASKTRDGMARVYCRSCYRYPNVRRESRGEFKFIAAAESCYLQGCHILKGLVKKYEKAAAR